MEDSEKEPMESGQVDLPLNFATPLSARSGEPAEEVALPEEGAAEFGDDLAETFGIELE